MSGSSDLDSFHDGRQVAVLLVPRGVLPLGLVQYCSQHSFVIGPYRDSVWTPELVMKHKKKAEGHIGRNVRL